MTNPEELLTRLPKFSLDPATRDQLKEKIMLNSMPQRRFSVFFPRFALVCVAVLILVGGGIYMRRNHLNPFTVQTISAAEVLQKHIAKYLRPGTIYHLKYNHFIPSISSSPTKYELWDDQDSSRFYQNIIATSGEEKIQAFDIDNRWEVDISGKTVKKDIYIYSQPEEKELPGGRVVDLSDTFNRLIADGTLKAELGKLNDKEVYIIKDTRQSPDKMWDLLVFDRATFALLRVEQFETGSNQKTYQHIDYELQETLPRTPETLASTFSFVAPDGFTVYYRHYDTTTGYIEPDYIPQTIAVDPTPPLSFGQTTYIHPQKLFTFSYPDSFQITKPEIPYYYLPHPQIQISQDQAEYDVVNYLEKSIFVVGTDTDTENCFNFNFADLENSQKEEINGLVYTKTVRDSAAAGSKYQTEIYRTVFNQLCFEAVLTVHSSSDYNSVDMELLASSQQSAMEKLKSILKTLKLTIR